MAAVFQQPLLADATVLDNVGMGLRFRRTSRSEIARRATEWLERLGIAGLARRQARTLSGGEAQRTALARALVLAPDLLLLDEPFSALDQPSREALIADIGPIIRRRGMATVLVTHDRAEALALADRTAVLLAGRIAQVDDTARVFRSPVSEDVARFVGVETIVDGVVVSAGRGVVMVEACGHAIEVAGPARAGERVRLCLRPEDVTIVIEMASDGDRGARNRISGRVVRIVPAGPHLRVSVECGFELHALVTRRSVEEMRLQAGSQVVAQFDATALHVLRPTCLDTSPGRGV
jgi:tungstate transport system ATP-binding protein